MSKNITKNIIIKGFEGIQYAVAGHLSSGI